MRLPRTDRGVQLFDSHLVADFNPELTRCAGQGTLGNRTSKRTGGTENDAVNGWAADVGRRGQ